MKVAQLLLVALLGGCASTYRVSPDMQSTAAAMSDLDAQRNLARLLRPSEKAGGLCIYSNGAFIAGKNANVRLDGNRLHFLAPVISGVHTDISTDPTFSTPHSIAMKTTVTNIYSKGEFMVDLTRLDNLRLVDVGQDTPGCEQKVGRGKVVTTMLTGHMVLQINVSDDDVPELMASLIHIAPNAKIVTGHGF